VSQSSGQTFAALSKRDSIDAYFVAYAECSPTLHDDACVVDWQPNWVPPAHHIPAIPEPATWAVFAIGLMALFLWRRYRR
jgi:hypothetical protein